jgi:DNA-binding transcriptional ArsR family regulator
MSPTGNRRVSATDRVLYERQAAICKAFAHPNRLQLIDLLGKGERSCSDLQRKIGISKANLSQHISQLKNAGIVLTRREGKQIFCFLAIPEVKQACQMIRNVLRSQLRDAHRMLSR